MKRTIHRIKRCNAKQHEIAGLNRLLKAILEEEQIEQTRIAISEAQLVWRFLKHYEVDSERWN